MSPAAARPAVRGAAGRVCGSRTPARRRIPHPTSRTSIDP